MYNRFWLLLIVMILTISFVNAQSADNLEIGLRHYWNFDANNSLLIDFKDGSNNATLHRDVNQNVDGILNNAYNFTGNFSSKGGYVNASNWSDGISPNWTVSFWFNTAAWTDTSGAGGHLLGHTKASIVNDSFRIVHNAPNSIQFAYSPKGTSCLNTVTRTTSLNTWYHYVVTSTGDNFIVYINGTFGGNQVPCNLSQTGFVDDHIYIGASYRPDSASSVIGNYTGKIDELGFWNRTLNASEIGILYNNGLGRPYPYSDVVVLTESFNATTTENEDENININITYRSDLYNQINAVLVYNNTNVTPTDFQTGDNIFYSADIKTPIIDLNANINFHWEFRLLNTTSGFNKTVLSTVKTQFVQDITNLILATSCAAGFHPAVNFTSVEEHNITRLLTDTEVNIKYGITNLTAITINESFNNIESFLVCINQSVNNIKIGQGEVFYGEGDYVERRFFVFNGVALSNTTTIVYSLHNLIATDATSFLIRVRDVALNPFANIYASLLRWYPERNEYRTVEMSRTDENGEAVFKVIPEDVDYRISANNLDGSLITITDPTRLVCLVDPCTYDVFFSETDEFEILSDLDVSLTFDHTTDIFTLIWNDPAQNTEAMNLTVFKDNPTSSYVVCSSRGTGFTGALACDVSGQSGKLRAVAFRESSPQSVIATLLVSLNTRISEIVGGNVALFGVFLVIIVTALIGAFISPMLALVFSLIALIPALYLGVIDWKIFGAALIIFIAIGYFIRRATSNE